MRDGCVATTICDHCKVRQILKNRFVFLHRQDYRSFLAFRVNDKLRM